MSVIAPFGVWECKRRLTAMRKASREALAAGDLDSVDAADAEIDTLLDHLHAILRERRGRHLV